MAIITRPKTTTRVVPKRTTSLGDCGAATISPSATGVSMSPDFSGLYPSRNWKYWVSRNVDAYSENWVRVTVAEAAENLGFLNTRRSSMGFGVCRSHQTNRGMKTAAIAKPPSTTADPQPSLGASMMPTSRPTSPMIDSPAPSGSNGDSSGDFDSGTNQRASTNAVAQTGTLIRNTADQPKCSTRTPPSTGPSAMLTPLTPAQTPIARARSLGSRNVFVMMDNVVG